jgi:hypothetical protein
MEAKDMNLVNELQVSTENDDVLTVLRKTKRLASKLDRKDIAEWLHSEQSGYADGQSVPDYRKIGTTLAYNTNGYIPAGYGRLMNGIEDLPSCDVTAPAHVRDSISTVLSWIESLDNGRGIYHPIPEGSEYCRAIRNVVRFHPLFAGQITFLLHFNSCQLKAVPEQIKDKVLEWACALEAAGVTGDGMSFSSEERRIAHSVTFNISNSHIEQLTNSGLNQR